MDIPLAKQEELWERYQQTERFKHLDAIAEEANRAAEKASKKAFRRESHAHRPFFERFSLFERGSVLKLKQSAL